MPDPTQLPADDPRGTPGPRPDHDLPERDRPGKPDQDLPGQTPGKPGKPHPDHDLPDAPGVEPRR